MSGRVCEGSFMKTIFISLIYLIFLLIAPSIGACRQEPIIITTNGSIIDVEASGAPLRDVLKAISDKMGILLKLEAPLTETVSLNIKAMPAEDALKQLLANRSYTLSFKKMDDGQFTPVELLVVANRQTELMNIPGVNTPGHNENGTPADSQMMKKIGNDQYAQQPPTTDTLVKQTSIYPSSDWSSSNNTHTQIGITSGGNISASSGAPMLAAWAAPLPIPSSYGGQSSESNGPIVNNRIKQLNRDQYELQFGNVDSLSQQISAIPIIDGPLSRGIKITNVAENSVLGQLGLGSGDIVNDVNGKSIQSTQQFLQSLSSPSEGRSIVRIERTRNGRTDPIYINLR